MYLHFVDIYGKLVGNFFPDPVDPSFHSVRKKTEHLAPRVLLRHHFSTIFTFAKTNRAPEQWWLGDHFPLGNLIFMCYVSFREGKWGGGISNMYCLLSPRKLGEDEPILNLTFFRWVETTNSFKCGDLFPTASESFGMYSFDLGRVFSAYCGWKKSSDHHLGCTKPCKY